MNDELLQMILDSPDTAEALLEVARVLAGAPMTESVKATLESALDYADTAGKKRILELLA